MFEFSVTLCLGKSDENDIEIDSLCLSFFSTTVEETVSLNQS